MKPLFERYECVHLVGVGGAGMEGLARVLRAMGCTVTGSDRMASATVAALRRDGFTVHEGHRPEQVGDAELVVHSAAVPGDNVELAEARRRGLMLVGRAALLGELSRFQLAIGVAGSHGKSTTASMLAEILRQAGREPSVLIGAWRQGRSQACLGAGRWMVVEADEYHGSFLELHPTAALITSVDAEHLDWYADLAAVEDAFRAFLDRLPFHGVMVVAGDGRVDERVYRDLPYPCLTYGLDGDCRYRATDVRATATGSRFAVTGDAGPLGDVELQVPGEHNLRNALGALTMALHTGIGFGTARRALASFTGVARRFEPRGEVNGVLVVDDYAHHPTEVAAALATAGLTGRRIIAVFQPHLFSRTKALCGGFARSLSVADSVFLDEVYAAREEPLEGVDSELIARALHELGHRRVCRPGSRRILVEQVLERCRAGDLVLTLGAGDVDAVAGAVMDGLRQRAGSGEPSC